MSSHNNMPAYPMRPLHVEYAKSSRSRCGNKYCRQTIQKDEVRIGYAAFLDVGQSAVQTMIWRHLPCFSSFQLAGAVRCGVLDTIRGVDRLAPADRALIEQLKRGELLGRQDLIGRIGDVAEASGAAPAYRDSLAQEDEEEGGEVGELSPVTAPSSARGGEKRRGAQKAARQCMSDFAAREEARWAATAAARGNRKAAKKAATPTPTAAWRRRALRYSAQ